LHAERAEVSFVASDGGDVAHVRLGTIGRLGRSSEPPTPADQWLLSRVVGDGAPLLITRGTRNDDERRWLDAQVAREAIAVPLRGGAGVLGVLVVTDRLGDVRSFDGDDVLLLETVAGHASVALQNGNLLDQMRHEAMHDALTGLPNRAALQRQLSAALEEVADGRSRGAAVMILDLDRFKDVNETLGHQQGDLLLVEVGTRLKTAVGPGGLVARLGGDEFAILLSGTDDEDRAVRVGRRLLRSLEQPVSLDGLEVEIGGSLGLALAPAHATDPAALLKRADMAMYDAKASTGGLRVYEADPDSDNPRRLMLVSELRTALHQGRIEVHVQPQARLATGGGLGVVHRHVRPLEQRGGVGRMDRREREAQRAADLDLQPVEGHRLLERAQQPPADPDGAVLVVGAAQQDGELVTAEPGDEAARPDRGPQPGADLDQELVAVLVPEGVVDLLEPIEVEDHDRGAR